MFFSIFNSCFSLLSGILGGLFYFLNSDAISGVVISKTLLIFIGALIAGYLVVNLLEGLFFVIVAFFINPKKEYKSISSSFSKIFIGFYAYVLNLFHVKVHVTGLDKVPFSKDSENNEKFLAVCNHKSGFDCFIMAVALKNEVLSFITKPENYNIIVANRYMVRGLYLSIDRDDVRNALKTIVKGIDFITSKIVSIAVFPEGTRSKDGKLGEFKPGCLKIAERAECPIVVCTVQGTEKILKNFPFKKTDVYFDVIKVISDETFSEGTTVDVSDEIRQAMLEKLGE